MECHKSEIISIICDILSCVKWLDTKDLQFVTERQNRNFESSEILCHIQKLIQKLSVDQEEENTALPSSSTSSSLTLSSSPPAPVPVENNLSDILVDEASEVQPEESYKQLSRSLNNHLNSKIQVLKIENKVSGVEDVTSPIASDITSPFVQIKANKNEIDRRIVSYMTQKQREVNEFNKREFSIDRLSQIDSCARTESVFIPRAGSRSHIKITKIVNSFGPQTEQLCTEPDKSLNNPCVGRENSLSSVIEKRLEDIESHTQMKTDSKDICARLKAIEERILFLESLSPEYFQQIPPKKYRKNSNQDRTTTTYDMSKSTDELSVSEIDSEMQQLRDSLIKKHTIQ